MRNVVEVSCEAQLFCNFTVSNRQGGKARHDIQNREEKDEGQQERSNTCDESFHHQTQVSHDADPEDFDDSYQSDQTTEPKKGCVLNTRIGSKELQAEV